MGWTCASFRRLLTNIHDFRFNWPASCFLCLHLKMQTSSPNRMQVPARAAANEIANMVKVLSPFGCSMSSSKSYESATVKRLVGIFLWNLASGTAWIGLNLGTDTGLDILGFILKNHAWIFSSYTVTSPYSSYTSPNSKNSTGCCTQYQNYEK